MTSARHLRSVAFAVLLIAALQIGVCALDCDCFFPSAAQVGAHAASYSDGDGCLCCAQYASVQQIIDLPSPMAAEFALPPVPPQGPRNSAPLIDRPPRS